MKYVTDYSNRDNWMHFADNPVYDVDIIYFLPTSWTRNEGESLICEATHEGMRSRGRAIYTVQASAFEQLGNMFAPFYRQYDAVAMVGFSNEQLLAVESGAPKEDCFAALDYYFTNLNNGRPYILCGHSQGAVMLNLILAEYMQMHPLYYKNMIVAYMIGYAVTKDWLVKNPHIKMAQSADDVGVVVSWNVEGPGNKHQYSIVCPEGAVCINPLNWKTDETYAGIEENLGSLVENEEGKFVLTQGVADAQIDLERGAVICKSISPKQYANPVATPLFGSESYHRWDYGFYYMNIRENVKVRIEAFKNR